MLSFFIATDGFTQTIRPTDEQQQARAIYQQFIEFPSGFSTGKSTPLVEAAAARLKAAGFQAPDIFVGGASPDKLNLVVRYKGTGEKAPILLLAHTDVVEAKRADWSLEPFKLTEKEGYFYGRGTLDDKAQGAIWLANLIQFKKEGYKPKRDIILALTTDEEGDSPYNGVRWLIKNHPKLISAEFALNEGGWGDISNGKPVVNNIQVSEKYIMDFRIEAHNKGGHSSIPSPDNAIYHLAAAINKISQFDFPLKADEAGVDYLNKMAAISDAPLKSTLKAAAQQSQVAMKKLAASSLTWNAKLRTTCIPTLLEGGHAKNALPQLAAANINCRVLPQETPEFVQKTLTKIINDPQIEIKLTNEVDRGAVSPLTPEIRQVVERTSNAIWPGVPLIPIMITGGTDGRFLRAAGIPTYGVMGLFLETNDFRAHGKDERILVSAFYQSQAFLYELVKSLSA